MANRIPAAAVRAAASPYVAGDSLGGALELADSLWRERGMATTLDALGEEVRTAAQTDEALALYQRAADSAVDRPWVTLSIKPGQFGCRLDEQVCERQVRALADRCEAQGTGLTLDMEDTALTDGTIALYRRLRPEFSTLGMVLQTKLYRTERDLDSLATVGGRVRLCIGVYDVPAKLGFRRKTEAKDNLLRLLPRALDVLDRVEIATHDEDVIRQARRIVEASAGGRDRVEFQMLLGVPRQHLQDELVAAGYAVRLYLPFVDQWDDAEAYLRRRLAESPSLAGLVMRNLVSSG
ncbi:MAG: proline dehydrogenase family protein [Deltaproteobacteria bacterium]|nr:proline dehydrogenase family protein [Deltaproteobacteria bacterium]